MDGVKYKTQEIQLNAGDQLFLYTDGVTEAADIVQLLYGERRLREHLDTVSGQHPQEICTSLKASIADFVGHAAQADDITMLALRINALHNEEA